MSKILGGSQGEGKVVCGGEALGGELGWDMRTWGCAGLPPYPGCPDVRGQPAQMCLPHSSRCAHRHCLDVCLPHPDVRTHSAQKCVPPIPRQHTCPLCPDVHIHSPQPCVPSPYSCSRSPRCALWGWAASRTSQQTPSRAGRQPPLFQGFSFNSSSG